jgi:hypothetical protein
VNGNKVRFKSKSVEDAPAPEVFPESELVTVPNARAMKPETFRLHLEKRHPRVRYRFISHHDQDHAHNPSLDHIHKELL